MALGKDVENYKQEVKKKEMNENQNNRDLISCLEEMKKEIIRLQKGSGGLEELGYKLEQSKIKQGHLQNLYLEEQEQKKELEVVIQGIVQEKERIRENAENFEKNLYDANEYIRKLEGDLKNKSIGVLELQQINEKATKEKEDALFELKQIPQLNLKINNLEAELNSKIIEIENMKKNSAGIASHNSVLSQEIKDIPRYLSKINMLEMQLIEKDKEKQALSKEISNSIEEKQQLQNKYDKLFVESQKQKNDLDIKRNETDKLKQDLDKQKNDFDRQRNEFDKQKNELDKQKNEKMLLEGELEALPAEKAKNAELGSIINELEQKIQQIENQNFVKLEAYSKEISMLHENLEHSLREIHYLKEICTEEENVQKQLRQEIKSMSYKIEELTRINKDLDQRLTYQSSANKEIVADLQKTLFSTVESIKTRTIPTKSRTFNNYQEEDLSTIYGKP